MKRTVGEIFKVRIHEFLGAEGNKKQAKTLKGEIISFHKEGELRDNAEVGDYVICTVVERTSSVRDDNGDVVLNEDGSPKLSENKFIRNEVVACGTNEEMTRIMREEEANEVEEEIIMEAYKAEIRATYAERKARPIVKAPVVVNANAEPENIGG